MTASALAVPCDRDTLLPAGRGGIPLRYFEVHRLKPDWSAFLDDFQRHWPTDEDNTWLSAIHEMQAPCLFWVLVV